VSRSPALNNVKKVFHNRIESSVELFKTVKPFATDQVYEGIHGWEPIHPSVVSQKYIDKVF
jgi:hypothetical protein